MTSVTANEPVAAVAINVPDTTTDDATIIDISADVTTATDENKNTNAGKVSLDNAPEKVSIDGTVAAENATGDTAAAKESDDSLVKQPDTEQDTMWSQWSVYTKIGVFTLGLLLYCYILFCVKAIYTREQRLNRISDLADETLEMIRNLHLVDRHMDMKIQELFNVKLDH